MVRQDIFLLFQITLNQHCSVQTLLFIDASWFIDSYDILIDIHIISFHLDSQGNHLQLPSNSGIMILYSVTDRDSFERAVTILEHLVVTNIISQYPVMFIGTKRDLSHYREVNRKEAFEISEKHNCTQFDVSAACDKNVKDCFHALFRQIEVRKLLGVNKTRPTLLSPPLISRKGSLRFGSA